MNRLSDRDWYLAKCEKCKNYECDFCSAQIKAFGRLAQYEDIGLTPEQLLQIDSMYTDRCKEIAELEKKLKGKMTNHERLAEITGHEEPVEDESFKMILEKIRDDMEHGLFESNYNKYLMLYKEQIKWLNSKAT